MWLGFLGPFSVRQDGTELPVRAAKQRVVLAALGARPGRVVSLDELCEALWDGASPAQARVTARNYVKRLRQALGPAAGARIVTRDPGYLLEADASEVDALAFGRLCAVGGEAARVGDWPRAAALLGEALTLWRGEPLADVPSQALRREHVPPLEQMRLQAVERRAEAGLSLGWHGELVPELQVLVARYPLHEKFHAQLMLALYRCGSRGEALAAYRRARDLLVEELGLEPGDELRELHQRILAGHPSLITTASPGPAGGARAARRELSAPRQLPASPRHFVGRGAELAALSGLIAAAAGTGDAEPGAATAVAAICGMPGVGKTALAVHWAHRVAGLFPDGQLYGNLRGFDPTGEPVPAHAAVRIFLDGLGVLAEGIPHSCDAQTALYRSMLAGKRMLVLIDNARDEQQVRPLLPGSRGCLVVVTSRNRLTGLVAVNGACALNLGVLSDAESRDLLERRLGAGRVGAEAGAARQIIRQCGGLPLALNIVAARAAGCPEAPLGALAGEMTQPLWRPGPADGDAMSDLAAVFSWSYRALGGPTARMFRLLSLHPGPDISLAAATSLASAPPSQVRRDLTALTAASMLAEDGVGRFSLHDLLRVYAAEKAAECDNADQCDAAVRRMLDHYLHTAERANSVLYRSADPLVLAAAAPGVQPEQFADHKQALAWFTAECQVLLAVTRASSAVAHYACELPRAISRFLRRQSRWQDEIAMQTLTLELAAAGRCDQLAHQAHAYRCIGAGFDLAGQHEQAARALNQGLGLFRQLGDTVNQARLHFSLGRVFQGQGQPGQAMACARTALVLFETAGHRPGQALALDGIGWCQIQLGQCEQALRTTGQALRLHRELGDLEGEACALDNFGLIHQKLGDTVQAIACYQRSLAIYEETGERYTIPWILARLGDSYRTAGDLPAATGAWRRAQAILDDLGHPGAEALRAKIAGLAGENDKIRL
jgi:DNA-binding SARP family transcriptional activator/tetratricopeptide (TPR) repeat protein